MVARNRREAMAPVKNKKTVAMIFSFIQILHLKQKKEYSSVLSQFKISKTVIKQ